MAKTRIIEPTFTRQKPRFPELAKEDIIDFVVFTKNGILTSCEIYKDNHSKQIGHRGFLSMIWNLFSCNKVAKKSGKSFDITVRFPLKWFK